MTHTRPRLLGAGLTAALAAGSLLTVAPSPAHAAPVFTIVDASPWAGRGQTSTCTNTSPGWPSTPSVPMTENGAPVTSSFATTAQYTNSGDNTDVLTNVATIQSSVSATTSGNLPKALTMSFNGTVAATASKPDGISACNAHATAGIDLDFEFTLSTPMWATLDVSRAGAANTYVTLSEDAGSRDLEWWDFDGTATVLLPAGTYGGYLRGELHQGTDRNLSSTASGRASLTFSPVGSASAAPSGSAGKYVALPGARNCTAHTATATLTTKKKLIKQIDKVTYTVNGTKAATLKGKKVKKGRTVALVLADNAPATIEATVLLDNGKKRTVTATYRPCTS